MPAVCPAELWQESGRGGTVTGKELLRIKDRNERDFAVRSDARGGRDRHRARPCARTATCRKNLYQIQGTKFRDEIRPRLA